MFAKLCHFFVFLFLFFALFLLNIPTFPATILNFGARLTSFFLDCTIQIDLKGIHFPKKARDKIWKKIEIVQSLTLNHFALFLFFISPIVIKAKRDPSSVSGHAINKCFKMIAITASLK